MQRIIIIIVLGLLWTSNTFSQSFPQNSLYLIDLYQINPAYGGLDKSLSVNFNYRDQWTGFDNNPKQRYLNLNLPFYLWNGGIGATVQTDRIGALNTSSLKFSYNNVRKTSFGIVSGGIALGITNLSLDGDLLVTPEGIYQGGQISHEDNILISGKISGSHVNYDLGLFIGTAALDFSLSISNMLRPSNEINGLKIRNSKVAKLFLRKPFYFRESILYPSILIRTDLNFYQSELSCLMKNGSVFGGMSIRGYSKASLDALVLIAGIKLNKHYTLSYSYDVGISSLKRVSQGAHELNIKYNLNKLIGIGLDPEIIYNPRNL